MSDTTPTPADLARELIRLDDANAEMKRAAAHHPIHEYQYARATWSLLKHREAHARTIAEALLAAEADNATLAKAFADRVAELERLAAENAALKAELATLRSQLSRIDYAFGEPNEMGVSPYDVDLDGERVVRQVEEMAKASQREPKTTMEAFAQLWHAQRVAMNQLVAVAASLGMCRVCGGSTERSGLIVTNHGREFAHERCLKGEAKGGG